MFTLHSELNQLEDSYFRYNDLRQKMKRELDIPHMTPAIAEALNTKEKEAIKGTHSISDLNKKFLALADELNLSLDKITAYKTLRQEIKALGMGGQDEEMTSYLSTCDEAIFASGNLDVTQIRAKIKEMNVIKAGLEKPENKAIVDIKNHFLENESWYTINMMVKGEMIEGAMAAIPIKERANLLDCTDETLTPLFSALAWHRVNRFASPISRDGKIMVSSAANAFNTFRKVYLQGPQSRPNIVVDEEPGNKPKP